MISETEFNDLDFECARCPSQTGIFTVRVKHTERKRLSTTYVPFRCPRGHKQTWAYYRGFFRVDSHGMTIDRNHPDWAKASFGDPLTAEYWGSTVRP